MMKKFNSHIGLTFAFIFINGCQQDIWSKSVDLKPNTAFVTNKELNDATENYIDKHLSEIIQKRDYPQSVDKVFCSHQTISVEEYKNLPPAFRASGNLFCKGYEIKSNTSIQETDPSIVEFITLVEETYHNTYIGVNGETPRHEPYYLGDIRRLFSKEVFEKILDSRKSPNSLKFLEEKINQKAINYYKGKKLCQKFCDT